MINEWGGSAPVAAGAPAVAGGSSGWRVGFGGLVALLGSAGMAAQYAISALSPFIVEDLGLTRTDLGVLPGAMFGVATITSLFTGPALDRGGTRRIALLTFALSTAALLGAAFAPTFAWLVASAGMAGLAVAAANPVTSSLVAAHVLPRPGVYLGLKQAGAQLYAFAVGATLAGLAITTGWRVAMACSCLPSVAGAWLVRRLVRREAPQRRQGPSPSLRSHDLRWLPLYAFLMGAAQGALVAYLPLYAYEAFGMTQVAAGMVVAFTGLSGVVGRVGWGYVGGGMTTTGLLGVLAASSVVCAGLILSATTVGPLALWAGATVYGVTAGAWATAAMLTVVRHAGADGAGHLSGRVMLGAYAGVLWSGIAFGALVDGTGTYAAGWGLVLLLSSLALALVLVRRVAEGGDQSLSGFGRGASGSRQATAQPPAAGASGAPGHERAPSP